ncbi:putative ankyrin repeat protein [Chloropicon roscoffensis]|uniref:Ankyrin repeat protein n=1 Tax=Chloropicon roscoffensis TaxID=1461544 RepID=A0AAX4PCE9_9CHLO
MARGAGEPSTKRAKVDETDEAKEEEDPLVLRKEEVIRLLGRARKGKSNARAKKELVTLCARLEAKNEKLLRRLPPELWQKIIDENVQQNDVLALAMACRFFREKQKDLGKKVVTNLNAKYLLKLQKSGNVASHTLGWFRWVCDTLKVLPGFTWSYKSLKGAVYEGNLVDYAAFQGSVEILRWLMEEKGCEPNGGTGRWAGWSGSVEILEYLSGWGYEFDKRACEEAAREGHLEALKFLRGLDPPCRWDWKTCEGAAKGGHLDVLKWARSEDPPCPWYEGTCMKAAEGGHLEVLKWVRDQDPPCPWDRLTCSEAAYGGHLEVLKWLRDQDPPCPWDWETCAEAAGGGHLDVLKWARAQNPPCPWYEDTCFEAAEGGQLEVLKWLRSEDPPCPWRRSNCREIASHNDHQHIVDWIDQREDESDLEPFDSDTDRSYDSYGDDYF